MNLARFPRVRLAHLPTPLEPMPRLTEFLGGPKLWVKRDDCTGLATGGNKTRKLEFLMAEAQAEGATHIITVGAYQSNHVRQTIAAACKLGLEHRIVLEHRVVGPDRDYLKSGNRLLDDLLGATIDEVDGGADVLAKAGEIAEQIRREGGEPYIIPGGGSNTTGALGYVLCAQEMLQQGADLGVRIDHVVTATGSAGTQAGLVAGFEGMNAGVPVLGISTKSKKDKQEEKVYALTEATADRIGVRGGIPRSAIVANDEYVGGGYGVLTDGMLEAMKVAARLEGLLFDPVYSGKGLDGLFDLCRKGHFGKDDNVVFLHTGGAVGIFGYLDAFTAQR